MKKLLLFLLLLGRLAYAQEKGFHVQGILNDSTSGHPVEFVTLTLLQEQKAVKGGYSQPDGTFKISGLEAGRYELRITAVGYAEVLLSLEIKSDSKDLGRIVLTENRAGLKEVKITAARPIVQQEADRLVYDTQADPESKVFSVLEMMRKVPFLSLDGDDNILLKGNGGFRIFINGKPSAMLERNYKDVLRSMPAASIQKIEVITTPPAKYDAEGLAGIINIITNKRIDNGYTGNLNGNWRGPVGGPGLGGTLSARLGKWGLSVFGGGNEYLVPFVDFSTSRTSSIILTEQQGANRSGSKNAYLGTEVSYELDSLNLFSVQFNVNGNKSTSLGRQTSRILAASDLREQYRLENIGNGRGDGNDVAFNYQRGFKADKNRLLTFSYRYFGFENNQTNTISIDDRVLYTLPDYRQVNNQRSSEQTVQTDFVYPAKKVSVEAGIKAIFRKNESDFAYLSRLPDSGEYQEQGSMSNRYSNAQNIYGLYNTYRHKSKTWDIRAGFRIEQTVLDADFISTGSTVSQNYFNVIPSVAIGRKVGKGNLGIGYTQRIQRPGIYQLNPFVDRTNPNFERAGNPNLRPSLMNDINVNYSWSKKTSVNVALGHVFIKNMIFPVLVYDKSTGISRASYDNVGRARLLPTFNVNVNHPFSKVWNFSLNGRIGYGMTEGIVDGKEIKNKGVMYGAFVSSGYRFPKTWRVNVNLNLNGPNLNIQDRTNGMLYSSLSVSKDLVKDKLSFSAVVNNPTGKLVRRTRNSFGPEFLQYYESHEYFRSFQMSLNYKFGKLKEPIKKASRVIRNDDVQNSN
jgi:ferric enterobactin receptor